MNRHIAFILDRSGSMASVKDATISGFNEYVERMRKADPDATFNLTQFDSESVETTDAKPMRTAALLTDATFVPRANTPLWDAVGKVISKSQDNPDTAYLVVVLTDGQENASQEWTSAKVRDLIKQKETTGRWTFAYLGSNQDAWAEAQKFGAHAGSTISYAAGAAGTHSAMASMTQGTAQWAAAAKSGAATATADFFAGVKCQDCGQDIIAGQTHACPKVKTT